MSKTQAEAVFTPWSVPDKLPALSDVLYERCTRQLGGSVARITINRPEKLNACTNKTMKEIMIAIEVANPDPSVGVVVLQGAGDRAFSTGGDVAWEGERTTADWFFDPPPNHTVRFSLKPMIAAVRGYAIGGGNHLAYTCDLTVAADNAIFGQIGSRHGSPADGYLARYLIRVIGAKRAREMWLTRRRSPTCIRILKAVFDQEVDEMAGDVRRVAQLIHPNFVESEEAHEAQRAFFEKRPPRFWPEPV